ncbi:CRISPR-associated helicase Cas3' [Acetobacteraceae bacterium B3987]|nr:CRISPR-associated helicase Cas3' [Acetobacteraceae bacterium B3987]
MQEWSNWPAKSARPPENMEHPAIYHMLDVAAVAEQLISTQPWSHELKQAFVALVGLHDLGKFSESFRGMLREGMVQTYSHWELTEVLLFAEDERLETWLGGTEEVRQILYAAVAGHHGRPPDIDVWILRERRKSLKAVGEGREAAQQLLDIFRGLWPEASLESLDEESARRFSWWLPGFCTAADWIGSNTKWFPPRELNSSPAEYLERARSVAQRAVQEAGLKGTEAQKGPLFDFALRPIQQACETLPLPDGPTLIVLEAETGIGKTEAAFILAQRMALAGKGKGMFFALPTMATADAMFSRASQTVGKLFQNPSVTLAHGRAGLSVLFKDVVADGSNTASDDNARDMTSSEWLAMDNRRALLADVGVGTIDQALLSALRVRFQTLRHYGLASKILVVDEVHEMGEPYVAEILVTLLKMHRAMGGSAILLTATLPLEWRSELLATYGGVSESLAYPAITVAGGESVTEFAADARPTKGSVKVERIATMDEAVQYLVQGAAQGAACVWVRNIVDDAIAAVDALREAGIDAHLLHARFALCDRKKLEKDVLECVGKTGKNRKGFVLVSTQIVEASLDLDFDLMVSDLASIGSLIQRVGRLWRHMDVRPAKDRPVPFPVLKLLSPDPADIQGGEWEKGTLAKNAMIYSLPDMWRTASVLFREGQITAPEGLRHLIEAVHGKKAEPLPSIFEQAELDKEGKGAAARGVASQNIVNLEASYRDAGLGQDDVAYPTRLAEPTETLVLARQTEEGLIPWALPEDHPHLGGDDAQIMRALWMLSEVSVRTKKLQGLDLPDQNSPAIQAVKKDWPKWKREMSTIKLCPVQLPGGEICKGLRYDKARGIDFVSSS